MILSYFYGTIKVENKYKTIKNKDLEIFVVNIREIKPFIRYAQSLTVNDTSLFMGQRAYDNRLFYLKQGKGLIRIEGTRYDLVEGDILIWRPGLLYDLDGTEGEFTLLGVNFDYTRNNSHLNFPIAPGKLDFNAKNIIEDVIFEDYTETNNPIHIHGFFAAADELLNILEEYRQGKILSDEIASDMLRSLLLRIFRQIITHAPEKATGHDNILRFINKNCDKPLSNEKLAKIFGYHPNHLSHLVLSQTGLSLHKYIIKCRIMRAIDLLQTTDMPANQIASLSGFGDYNHFLKYFKKITGKSTKDFR